MKTLHTILFMLLFIFPFGLLGQIIIIEESPLNEAPKTFGPNLKNYGHFFIGFDYYYPESDGLGAEIESINSGNFNLGYRYKRKICNYFALGFDVHFSNFKFRMQNNKNSTNVHYVPNNEEHDVEQFIFNNLGTEFYNRINFTKRGNHFGVFFDFGAYLNWSFEVRHTVKDNLHDNNNALGKRVVVRTRNLSFVEPFNYGAKIRFGYNRIVMTAAYRFSELFDNTFDSELPRVSIGLEFGLF